MTVLLEENRKRRGINGHLYLSKELAHVTLCEQEPIQISLGGVGVLGDTTSSAITLHYYFATSECWLQVFHVLMHLGDSTQ